MSDEEQREHAFWATQPVPQEAPKVSKSKEKVRDEDEGPLEVKTIDEVRKTSYVLPDGFEWVDMDTSKEEEIEMIYKFLTSNYVEDHDAMFRFDYSQNFLKWALEPPGFKREWHLGVRATKNKKLFGMITAIPATMVVKGETVEMVEINFLCVHKKLREKRLAPMLIREITRRCNMHGIFQAAYTAGVVVPTPIADCRYWHRNLNPKKLVETGFTKLRHNQTMARMMKMYKLPEETQIPGIRPLEPADVPQARELVHSYLDKFQMHPEWSDDEFAHWFLPRPNVVTAYVVGEKGGKITDFLSFYTLPSNVINNPAHKNLDVAYSFYNVATSVSLPTLMKDALILANMSNHDVFNALELMDNEDMLEVLKFGQGDGTLHYYLYNWKIRHMRYDQCGLVLL